jgi:hypothetical protein
MATSEAVGYEVYEVPERGDGRSRFSIDTSPSGFKAAPHSNLFNVLQNLLADRLDEARERRPKGVVEKIKMVAWVDGEYVVAERGALQVIASCESKRPGKLTSTKFRKPPAGDVLDAFFLGDPTVYGEATDADVWFAARALAEVEGLDGAGLRKLNDLTAIALLARAGFIVTADQLPHPHGQVV